MKEKISVIIPVYNTEQYLEKCIQSVLDQTYTNLEIICVDDGSTDNSGAILDAFAKKDERIKVIHKENEGVSEARNTALCVATGDWIGFVDSDDYIDADMYGTMLEANEQQEADIISCGYYLEYEDRCVVAENKKCVPTYAVDTREFLKYVYERDNYKGVASYLWTRLLRRGLVYNEDEKLVRLFSKEFDVSEDLVFLAELMRDSKKSLYVDKPMYHYLQRENSACHDEEKQLSGLSWIRAYLKILEIFEGSNVDEEVYNFVVRMMVFRCGKFMELAIKHNDRSAYMWLKKVVEKYYDVYVIANQEYPDRLDWLDNLLIGMQ